MRNVMLSPKVFRREVNRLSKIKPPISFQIITSRTTQKIAADGYQAITYLSDKKMVGINYLNVFHREFGKRLISNEISVKKQWLHQKQYKSTVRAVNYISNVKNKQKIYLDIDNAYWNVAYQLGYISYDFYMSLLKKGNKYKLLRNMCIGYLGNKKYIEYVENGKVRLFYYPKEDYKTLDKEDKQYYQEYALSLPVIGVFTPYMFAVHEFIWRLAVKFQQEFNENFYMFYTDAFIIEKSILKQAQEWLRAEGFKSKAKTTLYSVTEKEDGILAEWGGINNEKRKSTIFNSYYIFDPIINSIGKDDYYQYIFDLHTIEERKKRLI